MMGYSDVVMVLNLRVSCFSSHSVSQCLKTKTTWSQRQFSLVLYFSQTLFLNDSTDPTELIVGHKKLNSMAFSPQANYTDRATAACWRS
jgi:hypothetical protein